MYNQKIHRLDSAQDVLRMVRRKRISTAAIVTLVMELTSAYRRSLILQHSLIGRIILK